MKHLESFLTLSKVQFLHSYLLTRMDGSYAVIRMFQGTSLSIILDIHRVPFIRFSKTFAPNMRLGWITCNALFMKKLEILIDNSTQHPSGLGQSLMSEVFGENGWGMNGYLLWVWGVRNEYERRRNLFMEVFQREISTTGYASTALPSAGMFFWVKVLLDRHKRFTLLNATSNGQKTNCKVLMDELFRKCVDNGVLIMPGTLFAMQATDGYERKTTDDHILDVGGFHIGMR